MKQDFGTGNVILAFGSSSIRLDLTNTHYDMILPPDVYPLEYPGSVARKAIQNRLLQIRPSVGSSVAIAINDKTRPVQYDILLPPLLEELSNVGFKDKDILFFVSSGTHIPASDTEIASILPDEIISRFKVIPHNCDDISSMVELGSTSFGTRVLVNRLFFQSFLKILVGNIEPHHFMGYSGGNKTAAIGLTSRETISHNHSFLISPNAVTGSYEKNPCRLDVEEIGSMIKSDFALNAVLNAKKEIVSILFDDPVAVMRKGIPISVKTSQTDVRDKYDLVIVSAGGYPKDINLYQAHKAVTNAMTITRQNGHVILVAECRDGAGSKSFIDFLIDVPDPTSAINKFAKLGFQIGAHKAFLIARQLLNAKISLFSSMDSSFTRSLLIDPVSLEDIKIIVQKAAEENQRIAILPYGVTTVPNLTM